jgi:hypothetical protein
MEGIFSTRHVVVSARAGYWKVAEIDLITGWHSHSLQYSWSE